MMLDVGIIFPMEEFDWISPMVVQLKKTSDIQIYVDLRSLNAAYVHDPFPTPFIDEVLENVGGQEAYSFTDEFSGYHQVQIIRRIKTKPSLRWNGGLLCTIVMPFGLKNSPTVFSRIMVHGLQGIYSQFS
jgi:hypothetical protein